MSSSKPLVLENKSGCVSICKQIRCLVVFVLKISILCFQKLVFIFIEIES